MLLKDLPKKLQDFAILRMVEHYTYIKRKKKIIETTTVSSTFTFVITDECEEWEALFFEHNLEPMYTKYPELRWTMQNTNTTQD